MTPRMDEDETTRRLLHFTLEIISLLSGEDYTIVRKTPGEGVTPIIHLQESGGRSPDPITEPPPHPPIHERKRKKILELSNKMIDLLSGEVPIRCQDVAVYLSMEEWEYLEGHQDRYQEVMMEELRPLTSPGERRLLLAPVDNRLNVVISRGRASGSSLLADTCVTFLGLLRSFFFFVTNHFLRTENKVLDKYRHGTVPQTPKHES
ncbi:uncharacterized protein [Phyllobates terribilis]|uniref:uncharacterized protein n=1 Tax=Phyllobates terribilis TaxID=111132 RepID=UPI003CCAB20D